MFFQHKKYLILIYLIFLFLLIYCTSEVLAANSLTPEEVIKADILARNNHDLSTYLSLRTTKVGPPENRNEIMILREKYPEYDILQKSVNYNRQSAYNYAYDYWDCVCNDGYYMAQDMNGTTFAVPFPLGTYYTDVQYFFDHNTTYGQLYGADCAHFVSCCIGNNGGGGLPVPHNYSYVVYGYVSATGLADWILNNNYGVQKYSINDLEMGDVILYDWSGGGGHHIALYLGDGLIAAHSYCLWGRTSICLYGKSWIQPGLTVNKLIHITQSNPPIITITSPTNGTVWNVGETRSITWTVSGDTSHIDYFLLGYSIDGGNSYDLVNGVNSTAPATARTYSWTIPNTPSIQCKILVGAIDANGNSLTGAESEGLFTIAQAITPPTGVTATDGTYTDKIRITWNSVSGASYYHVYRATSSGGYKASLGSWQSNTSYDDTSATPGQTYYYFVKAATSSSGSNASDYSAYNEGWRKLSPPTGVTATDGTYTDKIRITWNSVSGASYYHVYRATSSGGSKTSLGSWQSSTSYDDTSATCGQPYYYFVKAATSNSGYRESDYSSYNQGYCSVTRIISLSGNLSFGDVQVGTTSTKTLTISNDGNSTLTVSSINYPTGFSGSWNGTISAGGSHNITVTFSPTQAITYSGTLTVNSDKTGGTNTKSISGTGVPEPTRIIRLVGDLNFGDVQVGTTSQKILTIYNDGNSTLHVASINYPTGFSGSWNGTISAGGSHNITVTFSPTQAITYSGTLTVNSDKTSGTNTKSISGTGVPSTSIPQVTTNNASGIASTSAQLNGNLDSTGNLSCLVWFEYGKTTSYGSSTSKQSKSSVGSFNKIISSVNPNTAYHFKACASNAEGTVYGADKTFTTKANSPGTASFSNVTTNSIQANWTANGNPAGTQYYCENTTKGTNSGWTTNLYWNSTGLSDNTTYHFQVKAKNADGVETNWTDLGSQKTDTGTSANLKLTPDSQSVTVGNQANINVVVEEVINLRGANITLNFDASKLQYVSSADSGFIPNATLMDSGSSGSVTLDIAGLAVSGYHSGTGTGTIMTVVFKRIDTGNTNITFGITILRDKDNITITHTKGSGCLFASLIGDFYPDCVVNFEDLMIFALAYGSTPTDPNWNPVCDIAGPNGPTPDGVIDFEDLMVFAMHYGKTCADL